MSTASNSNKIKPLFALLRIEYSWEGCFEYDRLDVGHSWYFSNSHPWRRISLEAKRGDVPIVKKTISPLLLTEAAKLYTDPLRSLFLDKAQKVSGKSVAETDWQLVGWLAGTNRNNNKVGRGLSLILNALVRQSTTKPFDLVSTFVGEHTTVEVRELGAHVPCWFYLRVVPFEDLDEYLVCFPELFLEKNEKGWALHNDVFETLKSLMHVRCKHHYEVIRIEQDDKKINVVVRDEAVITQYPKGAICGCIPVPGKCPRKEKRKEPEGVNSPEVVVTSPVVGKALVWLSSVWQDPYAKSVLISSPPGSGKEVFAGSIPVGNGRPTDKVFSLSMASDDQKGLERQLYGFAHPDGSIEDGLIGKASDGALFLDEVHQPETKDKTSAARASLLRTLEAGTYFPQESATEREVKNVLWVMATSKTPEELGTFKPVDFWTRMTHAQVIPHPLHFDTESVEVAVKKVVAAFFRTFWWDLCDNQYQIDPTSDPSKLKVNQIPAYWQQRTMLNVIVDGNGKPLDDGNPSDFASLFMKCILKKRMPLHEFSIRGIRSMASRLFAIAWSNVAQGRQPWLPGSNFGEDFEVIFNEILPVADLRPRQ